jgi:hypothetical protein
MALLGACLSLYKDEIMLENFAVMAHTAFSKIMKKHDKRTRFATREAFMAKLVNHQPFARYPVLKGLLVGLEGMYKTIIALQPRSQDHVTQPAGLLTYQPPQPSAGASALATAAAVETAAAATTARTLVMPAPPLPPRQADGSAALDSTRATVGSGASSNFASWASSSARAGEGGPVLPAAAAAAAAVSSPAMAVLGRGFQAPSREDLEAAMVLTAAAREALTIELNDVDGNSDGGGQSGSGGSGGEGGRGPASRGSGGSERSGSSPANEDVLGSEPPTGAPPARAPEKPRRTSDSPRSKKRAKGAALSPTEGPR